MQRPTRSVHRVARRYDIHVPLPEEEKTSGTVIAAEAVGAMVEIDCASESKWPSASLCSPWPAVAGIMAWASFPFPGDRTWVSSVKVGGFRHWAPDWTQESRPSQHNLSHPAGTGPLCGRSAPGE